LSVIRIARVAVIALPALLCAPALLVACTFLSSRDGLAGPPLEPDAAQPDTSIPADDGGDAGDASDATPDADILDAADANEAAAGPQTIYANLIGPIGLTVLGDDLFWVAGQPKGLFHAPRAGGGAVAHLDDASQPIGDAFDLAVDATFVYWTQRGGAVLRRGRNGGANEACFTASGSAAYIAIANGALFVTDFRLDGTGSVAKGTCGGASILFSNQSRASGIAATPQLVYWGKNQNDQIAFGPINGGSPSTFRAVVGAVGGVAVDADAVYWLRESRRVMRFTFASQIETELYDAGGPFGDGDIAVDDDAVYWTETANGVIKRLPKPANDGG
jgi:hypothetical protein